MIYLLIDFYIQVHISNLQGKDNLSKNNIVHRNSKSIDQPAQYFFGGCQKNHMDRPQSYTNSHNIYLLDDAEDFTFGRRWDRYYDEAPFFHHNLYWSMKVLKNLLIFKL